MKTFTIDGGEETTLNEFIRDNTSEGELQIESGTLTEMRRMEVGEVRIFAGDVGVTFKVRRTR